MISSVGAILIPKMNEFIPTSTFKNREVILSQVLSELILSANFANYRRMMIKY
jgi:hypothetical protein